LSARFRATEPLAPRHNVERFECGRKQLDSWLRAYAGQGQRRDTARTFVVCRRGETDVVGYYTLVASQVDQSDATVEVRRGTSQRFPIPVCLIARLAVDRSVQGVGLGRSLLLDALQRAERASRSVAMRAVLVHALDEEAAAFYARYGFRPASADALMLMAPLEAVRRTLGSRPMPTLPQPTSRKGPSQ
jgi:predicted N-acetyltransferase YhbS